jgi:hypothetical protein
MALLVRRMLSLRVALKPRMSERRVWDYGAKP